VQDKIRLPVRAQQEEPRREISRAQRRRCLDLSCVVVQHVSVHEVSPARTLSACDALAMTPERASQAKQREAMLTQEEIDLTEESLPLVLVVELDFELNELQILQNAAAATKHIQFGALNIHLQAIRSQVFARRDLVEGDH